MTRLIVLAWGNPSRGDDALGPEFLRCAEALVVPAGHHVEYVTDFQLQPEHATDLVGRDLALFVDASVAAPAPFAFSAVAPARDLTFTSHAMSPAAVLAACEDALGPPPPGFVLAIRGEHFELGKPMGTAATETLRQALAFYERLLGDPTASAWKKAMPVLTPNGIRAGLRGRAKSRPAEPGPRASANVALLEDPAAGRGATVPRCG